MTVTTLSAGPRIAYSALLLVSLAVSGVVGSLLVTEPALPRATALAFGVIVLLGAGWAVVAGWILARRQVRFAWHRVIAARMGVAGCALFLVGVVAVALFSQWSTRVGSALWVALLLLAASVLELVRAGRRHAQLLRRRDGLTRLVDRLRD